jgi:hypothetical protein
VSEGGAYCGVKVSQRCQIPPDFVVKYQAIDIAEILFSPIWRRHLVHGIVNVRKNWLKTDERLDDVHAHSLTTGAMAWTQVQCSYPWLLLKKEAQQGVEERLDKALTGVGKHQEHHQKSHICAVKLTMPLMTFKQQVEERRNGWQATPHPCRSTAHCSPPICILV